MDDETASRWAENVFVGLLVLGMLLLCLYPFLLIFEVVHDVSFLDLFPAVALSLLVLSGGAFGFQILFDQGLYSALCEEDDSDV